MGEEKWVRVTGQTVFAFPPQMTGSQLEDGVYQLGTFQGDGLGQVKVHASVVVNGHVVSATAIGQVATRLEAIARILSVHKIVATAQSVGIR